MVVDWSGRTSRLPGNDVVAELTTFARVLLDDQTLAGEIVGAVLADTGETSEHVSSVRFRQLAHLVYVRSNSSRLSATGDEALHEPAAAGEAPSRAAPLDAGLGELSDQQRDAIALNLFGAYSRAQSAKEMCLPEDVVTLLIRSGLKHLRSTRSGGG